MSGTVEVEHVDERVVEGLGGGVEFGVDFSETGPESGGLLCGLDV